ncbi:MAG: hypothetical protein WCP35_17345 [Verrucomicrobiota bacterium]
MKRISLFLLVILLGWLFVPTSAHAQGGLSRKAVTELLEFFAKNGARHSAEELAKELAEIGGEKTVREIFEKAAAQGGDDLVRQVVLLAKSNGPRALKALEGDPALMTKALRSLPKGKVADAVIEASRQPVLMAKLVRAHGDDVLAASARHPGIGTQVIDEFGGAGLKAAKDLSTDEIITLAKVKGYSELPKSAQGKFLSLLDRDPKAVTNLLILTGGGTAIVLTADFVKKAGDIIIGKKDEPGPIIKPMVTFLRVIGGILAAALAAYASIKLWGVWRSTRKTSNAS